MKVTIKRKHIRNGQPNSPDYCPIAIALNEKFGGNAKVNEDNLLLFGLNFHLPADAQYFIKRFDNGDPVKPFSFELKTLL